MAVREASADAASLEAAFAEALGKPAKPKEPKPPAEVDHEAPFGRDDSGKPVAKWGYTKDGAVRRGPQGRRAKDDQPRTGPAVTDQAGKDKVAAPGQYTKQLSDTAEGIWFALSALGKAAPGIPLIGARLPGVKIQAQAAVWLATKDRAVAAVSLAAEHNAAAARFAAKLQGDDITWMITCVSLVAPVVSLSATIWAKDADAKLKEAEQPSLDELAARNDVAMDQAIAQITAQLAHAGEQAMEQQAAAMNGAGPGA